MMEVASCRNAEAGGENDARVLIIWIVLEKVEIYIWKSELWLLQVLLLQQFVFIPQESSMLLMP